MFYLLKLNFDHSMNDAVKRNFPMTRVSDPVFLHGSGSGFQISLDPDPVFKFSGSGPGSGFSQDSGKLQKGL